MDINKIDGLPFEDVQRMLMDLSKKINNDDKMRAALMIWTPGSCPTSVTINKYITGQVKGVRGDVEQKVRKLAKVLTIFCAGTEARETFIANQLETYKLA